MQNSLWIIATFVATIALFAASDVTHEYDYVQQYESLINPNSGESYVSSYLDAYPGKKTTPILLKQFEFQYFISKEVSAVKINCISYLSGKPQETRVSAIDSRHVFDRTVSKTLDQYINRNAYK